MTVHAREPFAADESVLRAALRPARTPAPRPVALYPAGAEIFAQGERPGKLYQVEFGTVRVYRLLSDGRRQIAAFYLVGEVFGFEAGDTRRFFAEAIAETAVRVIAAATSDSAQMLPLALKTLAAAQEHLLVLGRQSATERVAGFLLDLSRRQGRMDIDLPMTRTDIADYLGLTMETVSRALSRLKADRIIRLCGARTVDIGAGRLQCVTP